MKEPIPNNNEFEAAEIALRKIGSNLWFSSLSAEWQDFLVSNTLEHFDTYDLSMHQAATSMISVFQKIVEMNPAILEKNPWETTM
ncbi:hypothetical protein [Microbulbifer hydrolyticus]|uniref:Uncharacterized protein n=1 Tax=Microbulbifer hydrolyticus TaxID=48074 RepID=A0A6P1T7R8_9GAMM|nr:hypothetical protein [Microbulbifer hydrolyticus]MBB5211414.1 hypothetical protein [Microbulbifer hydrolyticus]QHQ37831.1 hypothetical protein GTQ55_01700 [Microbulbifer hydrolyticus]